MTFVKSLTIFVALLFLACAPIDLPINEEALGKKEFTGGVQEGQNRAFTQVTDGSDGQLSAAKYNVDTKSKPNQNLSKRIQRIDVSGENSSIAVKVSLNNPSEEWHFAGQKPSQKRQTTQLKALGGENSQKMDLYCANSKDCQSVIAALTSDDASSAFVIRQLEASARILYFDKKDIQNTIAFYKNIYPLVETFFTTYTKGAKVLADSAEIVMGKTSVKIDLPLGPHKICLDGELTNTDADNNRDTPASLFRMTCGENLLPIEKIELVGNNQSGRIGLKFYLAEQGSFIMYIDFNGSSFDTPSTSKSKASVSFKKSPQFLSELNNPRTAQVMAQFYDDIPTPQKTSYGEKVLSQWLDRWQGKKVPLDCLGVARSAGAVRSDINQFLKASKKHFSSVANLFKEQDIPANFMFITLSESPKFYNSPSVIEISNKNAVGPWQLLEGTARENGLNVFPLVGGRHDPRDERGNFVKATGAALSYLHQLFGYYGDSDYKLAIAAYNSGAHGLYRHLRRLFDSKNYQHFLAKNKNVAAPEDYQGRLKELSEKTEIKLKGNWEEELKQLGPNIPDFWFLHEFHMMACETRDYVPKIVSAMIIGEDPKAFGF